MMSYDLKWGGTCPAALNSRTCPEDGHSMVPLLIEGPVAAMLVVLGDVVVNSG